MSFGFEQGIHEKIKKLDGKASIDKFDGFHKVENTCSVNDLANKKAVVLFKKDHKKNTTREQRNLSLGNGNSNNTSHNNNNQSKNGSIQTNNGGGNSLTKIKNVSVNVNSGKSTDLNSRGRESPPRPISNNAVTVRKNQYKDPVKEKEKKKKNDKKERLEKLKSLNDSIRKGIKQSASYSQKKSSKGVSTGNNTINTETLPNEQFNNENNETNNNFNNCNTKIHHSNSQQNNSNNNISSNTGRTSINNTNTKRQKALMNNFLINNNTDNKNSNYNSNNIITNNTNITGGGQSFTKINKNKFQQIPNDNHDYHPKKTPARNKTTDNNQSKESKSNASGYDKRKAYNVPPVKTKNKALEKTEEETNDVEPDEDSKKKIISQLMFNQEAIYLRDFQKLFLVDSKNKVHKDLETKKKYIQDNGGNLDFMVQDNDEIDEEEDDEENMDNNQNENENEYENENENKADDIIKKGKINKKEKNKKPPQEEVENEEEEDNDNRDRDGEEMEDEEYNNNNNIIFNDSKNNHNNKMNNINEKVKKYNISDKKKNNFGTDTGLGLGNKLKNNSMRNNSSNIKKDEYNEGIMKNEYLNMNLNKNSNLSRGSEKNKYENNIGKINNDNVQTEQIGLNEYYENNNSNQLVINSNNNSKRKPIVNTLEFYDRIIKSINTNSTESLEKNQNINTNQNLSSNPNSNSNKNLNQYQNQNQNQYYEINTNNDSLGESFRKKTNKNNDRVYNSNNDINNNINMINNNYNHNLNHNNNNTNNYYNTNNQIMRHKEEEVESDSESGFNYTTKKNKRKKKEIQEYIERKRKQDKNEEEKKMKKKQAQKLNKFLGLYRLQEDINTNVSKNKSKTASLYYIQNNNNPRVQVDNLKQRVPNDYYIGNKKHSRRKNSEAQDSANSSQSTIIDEKNYYMDLLASKNIISNYTSNLFCEEQDKDPVRNVNTNNINENENNYNQNEEVIESSNNYNYNNKNIINTNTNNINSINSNTNNSNNININSNAGLEMTSEENQVGVSSENKNILSTGEDAQEENKSNLGVSQEMFEKIRTDINENLQTKSSKNYLSINEDIFAKCKETLEKANQLFTKSKMEELLKLYQNSDENSKIKESNNNINNNEKESENEIKNDNNIDEEINENINESLNKSESHKTISESRYQDFDKKNENEESPEKNIIQDNIKNNIINKNNIENNKNEKNFGANSGNDAFKSNKDNLNENNNNCKNFNIQNKQKEENNHSIINKTKANADITSLKTEFNLGNINNNVGEIDCNNINNLNNNIESTNSINRNNNNQLSIKQNTSLNNSTNNSNTNSRINLEQNTNIDIPPKKKTYTFNDSDLRKYYEIFTSLGDYLKLLTQRDVLNDILSYGELRYRYKIGFEQIIILFKSSPFSLLRLIYQRQYYKAVLRQFFIPYLNRAFNNLRLYSSLIQRFSEVNHTLEQTYRWVFIKRLFFYSELKKVYAKKEQEIIIEEEKEDKSDNSINRGNVLHNNYLNVLPNGNNINDNGNNNNNLVNNKNPNYNFNNISNYNEKNIRNKNQNMFIIDNSTENGEYKDIEESNEDKQTQINDEVINLFVNILTYVLKKFIFIKIFIYSHSCKNINQEKTKKNLKLAQQSNKNENEYNNYNNYNNNCNNCCAPRNKDDSYKSGETSQRCNSYLYESFTEKSSLTAYPNSEGSAKLHKVCELLENQRRQQQIEQNNDINELSQLTDKSLQFDKSTRSLGELSNRKQERSHKGSLDMLKNEKINKPSNKSNINNESKSNESINNSNLQLSPFSNEDLNKLTKEQQQKKPLYLEEEEDVTDNNIDYETNNINNNMSNSKNNQINNGKREIVEEDGLNIPYLDKLNYAIKNGQIKNQNNKSQSDINEDELIIDPSSLINIPSLNNNTNFNSSKICDNDNIKNINSLSNEHLPRRMEIEQFKKIEINKNNNTNMMNMNENKKNNPLNQNHVSCIKKIEINNNIAKAILNTNNSINSEQDISASKNNLHIEWEFFNYNNTEGSVSNNSNNISAINKRNNNNSNSNNNIISKSNREKSPILNVQKKDDLFNSAEFNSNIKDKVLEENDNINIINSNNNNNINMNINNNKEIVDSNEKKSRNNIDIKENENVENINNSEITKSIEDISNSLGFNLSTSFKNKNSNNASGLSEANRYGLGGVPEHDHESGMNLIKNELKDDENKNKNKMDIDDKNEIVTNDKTIFTTLKIDDKERIIEGITEQVINNLLLSEIFDKKKTLLKKKKEIILSVNNSAASLLISQNSLSIGSHSPGRNYNRNSNTNLVSNNESYQTISSVNSQSETILNNSVFMRTVEEIKKEKTLNLYNSKIAPLFIKSIEKNLDKNYKKIITNLELPFHIDEAKMINGLMLKDRSLSISSKIRFCNEDIKPESFLDKNILNDFEHKDKEIRNTDNIVSDNYYDKILNTCVFDTTNEIIEKYRKYGIIGEPLPWSIRTKEVGYKFRYDEYSKAKFKHLVIKELKKIIGVRMGLIAENYDYLDMDQLNQDRDKKFMRSISNELKDNEDYYQIFETQETYVKLSLSRIIMDQLLNEVVEILEHVQYSRREPDKYQSKSIYACEDIPRLSFQPPTMENNYSENFDGDDSINQ